MLKLAWLVTKTFGEKHSQNFSF